MAKKNKPDLLKKKQETFTIERKIDVGGKESILPLKITFDNQTGYVTLNLKITTKQLSPDPTQKAVTLAHCMAILEQGHDAGTAMVGNFLKANSMEAHGQINMFDALKAGQNELKTPDEPKAIEGASKPTKATKTVKATAKPAK